MELSSWYGKHHSPQRITALKSVFQFAPFTPSLSSKELASYGIAILSAFVWGAYFVANRAFLIHDVSPIMLACGSGVVGSILSTLSLFSSKRKLEIGNFDGKQYRLIVVYSLAALLRRVLLFSGQAYVSATNTGFLLAGTRPLFAFLFGFAFMREFVNGSHVYVILSMILGVFFLTTGGNIVFHVGDMLLILCGMMLGFLSAFSRKITTAGVNPRVLTFFEMTISTIGLVGLAAISSSLSFAGWEAWLLSGGLFFLATFTRNLGLSQMTAALFSTIFLLSPVFTAVLGIALLQEQMMLIQAGGGALILLGTYQLIRLGSRARSQEKIERPYDIAPTSAILEFYQLRTAPFYITSEPEFSLMTPSYKEGFAVLWYGIHGRRGAVAILGESGVGKTMLLRTYLNRVSPQTVKTIYLEHANVSFPTVLEKICDGVHLQPQKEDVASILTELKSILIDEHNKGKLVALIIDDVQHMPIETWQDLHLLFNLEMEKEPLIQIVLSGQPAVERTWELPILQHLKSCIGLRATILPFTPAESQAYIQRRLAQASLSTTPVFTDSALKRVMRQTAGNLRTINTVCNSALITGFANQQQPISASVMQDIITYLSGIKPRLWPRRMRLFFVGFFAGFAFLVGLLLFPPLQHTVVSWYESFATFLVR